MRLGVPFPISNIQRQERKDGNGNAERAVRKRNEPAAPIQTAAVGDFSLDQSDFNGGKIPFRAVRYRGGIRRGTPFERVRFRLSVKRHSGAEGSIPISKAGGGTPPCPAGQRYKAERQSNHSSAGSNAGRETFTTFSSPTARWRQYSRIRTDTPGSTGTVSPSTSRAPLPSRI